MIQDVLYSYYANACDMYNVKESRIYLHEQPSPFQQITD